MRRLSKEKVYFAAASGRLKVGTTNHEVSDRIREISSHLPEPLTILGWIDGGLPLERAIQSHFSPWHIKGEWFRDCDEIRAGVQKLLTDGPAAIGYDGPMFSSELPRRLRSEITRDFNPKAFGIILRLMWGDAAARQLSAFAEVDIETASRWLDDATNVPRLVRYAVSFVSMTWMMDDEDKSPNFLEPDESGGGL